MRLSYLLFERTELAGGLFQRLAEASVLLDEFLHGAAHTRRGLQAVILLLLQKGEVLTGLLEFLTCILRFQAVLFRIGSKLVRKILFNGGKLLFDILTVQKSDIQLRFELFVLLRSSIQRLLQSFRLCSCSFQLSGEVFLCIGKFALQGAFAVFQGLW